MHEDNSNTPQLSKTRILKRIRRKLLARHLWLARFSLAFFVLTIIASLLIIFWLIISSAGLSKYLTLAYYFVSPPMSKVENINNHTNILILGKGGAENSAPDLTDTMIFVSISHAKVPKISLVSLPRDLWITELRAKLNSAYYWGNKKAPNGGLILAKSTVEQITGQPIHYAVVVDFSGFKSIIDALGGIEIDVQNSFEDKLFPILGKEDDPCYSCRYETVRFEKGKQTMDGETALKFSRSRHSEDLTEGTDLARSRRQQLVLEAIKNKALSRQTLTSPKKLYNLYNLVKQITETDIPESAQAILARRTFSAKNNIKSYSIPEDLLINPPPAPQYDNQYVFIPKGGDWKGFHALIANILSE